jgi:copper chaperone CopZ
MEDENMNGRSVVNSILAISCLILLLASCKGKNQELATVTISTPTVICGTCEKTISKAVYRVEGVKEVHVDLEKKAVQISYVPLQTNVEFLESAITAAGYDANDKKRDPEAYEQLAPCCKKEAK